jgi:hypothetical protein
MPFKHLVEFGFLLAHFLFEVVAVAGSFRFALMAIEAIWVMTPHEAKPRQGQQ